MIKQVVMRILKNPIVARQLIKPVLRLHNMSYKLASQLSIQLEDGTHPKHRIMRYQEWFVDHIETGSVVLDVGCNTGSMVNRISKKASFVYGIEINEQHYALAQRTYQSSNIRFICADATTYDYANCQAIDYVTLSNVLEHIKDRTDFLFQLIKQINWRNPQNKFLLIRVPMIDRDWLTLYKQELGVEYRLDLTHFTEYTFSQFEDELKSANIEFVSSHIRFGEIYAICKAAKLKWTPKSGQ